MKNSRLASWKTALPFLLPSLAGFVVFSIIPMIMQIFVSLTSWDGLSELTLFSDFSGFMDRFYVGIENYKEILTSKEFYQVIGNTLEFVILYIPLMLIASMIVALILNSHVKGVGIFRVLYYIPVITSWVAGALIWKWVLSPEYGAINNILALFGIEGPSWLQSSKWAINPNFIGINNIVAIFQQICVLGILTMAMSILLISGGIDLSIGNIMVVCGVVMYVVLDNGLPTFIAVLAGLVTGAACGLLNGAIIAKSKCIPLVITLGTSKMFYGIALTVSGGRIMNFGGAFNGLKTKYFEIFSPMLLVSLAMVMVAYLMMTYTKFGRRVVALGGNEKNAFLSGINVNRYKIIVYGISGLFCAVASIVFVARIDSITSNAGTNYETNALAAAIIGGVTFDGGKGTISGAFLGCLLMGVISNAMNILGVDNNVQTIITGAIIVAAVVLSNINNIKKK